MSVAVMSKVWEMPLEMPKKLVLLALADFANDEGLCWPSYQKLAKKCSLSRRHIMRIMNFFIEKKLVLKKESNSNSSVKRPNLYQINIENLSNFMPDGDNMSPLESAISDSESPLNQADSDCMSLGGDTCVTRGGDIQSLGGDTGVTDIRTIIEPSVRTISDPSLSCASCSENEHAIKKLKVDKKIKSKKVAIDKKFIAEKFHELWTLYPLKKSKGQAERTFEKLVAKMPELADEIIAGLRQHLPGLKRQKSEDARFVPHLSTWLKAKGWEDELEVSYQNPSGKTKDELRREKNIQNLLSVKLT